MNAINFQKVMDFFDYREGDRKRETLRLVLVEGRSQADACRSTGYNPSQLSPVIKRVREGLERVKNLTGVDLCE